MELVGRITDKSLKVGDIISQYAWLGREPFDEVQCARMELQRHIIIEVDEHGVTTSILFRRFGRDSDDSPGRQEFISFMTLMAGYWRKDNDGE